MKKIDFNRLIDKYFSYSILSLLKKELPNEDLSEIKEIIFDNKYQLDIEKVFFILLFDEDIDEEFIDINEKLSFYGDNFCIKPITLNRKAENGFNYVSCKFTKICLNEDETLPFENRPYESETKIRLNPFEIEYIINSRTTSDAIRYIAGEINDENEDLLIHKLKRRTKEDFRFLNEITYKNYSLNIEETLFLLCKYDSIEEIDSNIIFWFDSYRIQKAIIKGNYDFIRIDTQRPNNTINIVPKNLNIQKH